MNLGEKRWEKVKAFRIKVVENENVVIWKKSENGKKEEYHDASFSWNGCFVSLSLFCVCLISSILVGRKRERKKLAQDYFCTSPPRLMRPRIFIPRH